MTTYDDELGVGRAARAIRRRWWLPVAAAVAAVAGSGLMVALQAPVYRAETRLLVDTAPDSAFSISAVSAATADRAVRSAVQVMTGTAVRDRVGELVGADAPPVAASVVGATDVVVLRVEAADPTTARHLADAYAAAYIEVSASTALRDLATARAEVQANADAIAERLASVTDELAALPADDAARPALVELQTSLSAQQGKLVGRLAELDIDRALQDGGATVIRSASAAGTPVRPEPLRAIALAGVLGLLIGAGAALVLGRSERGVRSANELAAQLDLPLLASIPHAPAPDNRPLALSAPTHPFVEQIRVVRDGVAFAGVDRAVRTVLVTSASAREGKSTVAVNLAVVAAESGARVLLVDADLRAPTVAGAFALAEGHGLSDALMGTGAGVTNVAPHLTVLPAGSPAPNPAVLISSAALAALLRDVRESFDLVVIDGPPVMVAVDAAVLGGRVDGVVMVVRAHHSDVPTLTDALGRLERGGAQMVGAVFNDMRPTGRAPVALAPYGVGDNGATNGVP